MNPFLSLVSSYLLSQVFVFVTRDFLILINLAGYSFALLESAVLKPTQPSFHYLEDNNTPSCPLSKKSTVQKF